MSSTPHRRSTPTSGPIWWKCMPMAHCGVCRTKCKTCRGRIARLVKSTGIITYTVRQDCECTMVPGPMGFDTMTLLATGDLIRVADGRDRAAQVQGGVPLRHPEGDFGTAPAAPQGAASGTHLWRRGPSTFSSTASAAAAATKPKIAATVTVEQVKAAQATMPPNNIRTMPSCSDFLPAKDFASDFASSCNTRLQHDHEGREADDQRGVWCSTQCGCERRHHGEALDRAGAGVGGARQQNSWPVQRGFGIRRLSEHRPRGDSGINIPRDRGRLTGSHRRASRVQSRFPRFLGASLRCGLSRASPAFSARAFR